MRRLFCLLLLVPSFAFSQNANPIARGNKAVPAGSSASSTVQVLYVVDDSTLTTYNIDPQTFEPAVVGTTAMAKGRYARIVSSPNGQFLYYFANPTYTQAGEKLFVYQTDANGVPGNTPVQSMNAGQLSYLLVNPSNTFTYSVVVGKPGPYTTPSAIVRNVIGSNGALSQPVTEASYTLDTYSSGNDCYLEILGFNPAGTAIYDEINCSGPHDSGSQTFNQRSVDLQSGALGPDEQVYYFSEYAGSGYADVQFANDLLFAFVDISNGGPNANSVGIYQTQPYTGTELVNCTTTMLAICGTHTTSLAHPSGDYAFLQSTVALSDIVQVDLATQQLVSVGTFPGGLEKLSPDGSVIYGYYPSPVQILVAGFDAATARVTVGGSIKIPRPLYDYWTVAERY